MKNLYRTDCPTSTELGEYSLDLLNAPRKRYIRRHLEFCPICSEELSGLENYLSAVRPDVEHRPLEQRGILIAQRVSGKGRMLPEIPSFAPALAAVRGSESGIQLFSADAVQIAISITVEHEAEAERSVLGIISGLASLPCEVRLSTEIGLLATEQSDSTGAFRFTAVPSGEYLLTIISEDVEIHIQELKV